MTFSLLEIAAVSALVCAMSHLVRSGIVAQKATRQERLSGLESGWAAIWQLETARGSQTMDAWFEQLPYGVCVSRNGRVEVTNGIFANYVRAGAPEALQGLAVDDLISEQSVDELFSDEQNVGAVIHHLQRLDGSRLIVESATLEVSASDSLRVLIARDISEEEKLRKQIDHADRLASVGTMAAGVAHEVNNPLAYVIANQAYAICELKELHDSASEDDQYILEGVIDALDDAKAGAEQIQEIVSEMKNFSRAENGPKEPVDIPSLIKSNLKLAKIQLKGRASLYTSFEDTPPVFAVRSRLSQVFMNLLVNAAQAIPEDSQDDDEIRICVSSVDDRVVIEVSDTGRGIPSAIQDEIMTAFFTTKGVGEGMGLGLATSNGIVNALGGSLTFESEVGKGTTFRVELPAHIADYAPAEVEQNDEVCASNARVLVIDDEVALAKSFPRMLQDAEVAMRHDGPSGVALLESDSDFDVIFCDMRMPGMSGRQVYETVHARTPELASRFVFVTGSLAELQVDEFFSEISNPKLGKPLNWEQVRRIVAEYAAARATPVKRSA